MKKPKSIDLFSGCGGLGTGFEKADFDNVVSNDIWEPAKETFMHNNPSGNFILGDINQAKIKKEIIRKSLGCDVIVGADLPARPTACQAEEMWMIPGESYLKNI